MATYTSHYNLTKPEGTERVNIAIINQNMDSIDTQMYKNAQSIIANHGGMAIPSNNNTHAAVSSGQYVYVYNHSSLAEGLYIAKSAISTNGALSLSNLTAVSNGGLNHVYSTLISNIVNYNFGSKTLAQFQSELVTYASSMGYRTYKHISVEISAQSGLFLATTYVGTIEKLSSDTRFLVTLRNAYEAAPGDIEMTYKDGTWSISSINSNMQQLNLGAFSSLPTLDSYLGIVGFLLNSNVTVDTYYIPAGARIFGYIYNGIGHFVCLYTGASFTTLRYQSGQGWTVLQRFSNN